MISIGVWNDFRESMEFFPSAQEIIALGPRNDLHGFMEVFPWVN
jgi:hypothetical protein